MAILSLEEINQGLSLVDLTLLNKCNNCGSSPEWKQNEQIFTMRCSGCFITARGFICRPCLKEESDLSDGINKLTQSWNNRNDK